MGAIVVDSPGPFVSAYKPVQWTFVSDRSPNTIPGESGVQIWLIAVADQVTVSTIPGLAIGDVFVVLTGAFASLFPLGQTVQFQGTTAARYDGVHRVIRAIDASTFVIDATDINGSLGGTVSKYYERYALYARVRFSGVEQTYRIDDDGSGRFTMDIRDQAQRSFKDVFDLVPPGTPFTPIQSNEQITNTYTIEVGEGYNLPDEQGVNVYFYDFKTPLRLLDGKTQNVVNNVQPYHHINDWQGGAVDLNWDLNLKAYRLDISSPVVNFRALTYANPGTRYSEYQTVRSDDDHFLAFLLADPTNVAVRLKTFNGSGGSTTTYTPLDLFNIGSGSMILPIGPINLGLSLTVVSYSITLVREFTVVPITEEYWFRVDASCHKAPRRFYALNKFGAIDAFTFIGFEKREDSYDRKFVSRPMMPFTVGPGGSWQKKGWKTIPERRYSITSGTLSKGFMRYVADEIMESADLRTIIDPSLGWTHLVNLTDTNDLGFEHGTIRADYAMGVDNTVQTR